MPANLAPKLTRKHATNARWALMNTKFCEFDLGPWFLRFISQLTVCAHPPPDPPPAVPFFTVAGGETGNMLGTVPQFLEALAVYNNHPNTTINFAYAGVISNISANYWTDGINSVIFNDPFDAIPGSYDCMFGGTLALGGAGNAGRYGLCPNSNAAFQRSLEGDIVVQDGINCTSNRFGLVEFAQLYTHELGTRCNSQSVRLSCVCMCSFSLNLFSQVTC